MPGASTSQVVVNPQNLNAIDVERSIPLQLDSTVESAVRMIGAELEILRSNLLRAIPPGESALPFDQIVDIHCGRLPIAFTFFPEHATAETRADAAAMMKVIMGRRHLWSKYVAVDSPSARDDFAQEFLRCLDSCYERLSRGAFWSDRPVGLKLIEYDANLTGVPDAVVESSEALSENLTIKRWRPGPKEGFGYPPEQPYFEDLYRAPGSKVFQMLRDGTVSGFYSLQADPLNLPSEDRVTLQRAYERGIVSQGARVGMVAITGFDRAERLRLFRMGVYGYGAMDAVVMRTAHAEELDFLLARVREGLHPNTAIRSHLRQGWVKTDLVEYHGPLHEPYRIIARGVRKALMLPDSDRDAAAVKLDALRMPEKYRPQHAFRTPFTHASRISVSTTLRQRPTFVDDFAAFVRCEQWVDRNLMGARAKADFCSDGLVIALGARWEFRLRQLSARVDYWRGEPSAGRESEGTLDQMLAVAKGYFHRMW